MYYKILQKYVSYNQAFSMNNRLVVCCESLKVSLMARRGKIFVKVSSSRLIYFFHFPESLAVPKESFSNKVGNHILTTQKSFCKVRLLAINQVC